MEDTKNGNSQKIPKKDLRIFPYGINVQPALTSSQTNRRYFKQTKGGRTIKQPPLDSGIFLRAKLFGDDIIFPSLAINKIPSKGNSCSVPFWTLEGTRRFYNFQNFKNSKGIPAMFNAKKHGIATSVEAISGASPSQCNSCLLPSNILTDVIDQAKKDAAKGGKFGTGSGYSQLLKHFHLAIFPLLINETEGNTSRISRLLGLDRKSVVKYAQSVDLYHLMGAGQGGVKS